jgi:hypothetical protein
LGPLGEPPLPFFSIREDLRHSRAFSQTAEDCRCFNAPSVPP